MPFDVGVPELALILFVILLVFGPGKLPELGRNLGRAVAELRRATRSVTEEINRQIEFEDAAQPTAWGLRRGCLQCRHINPEDSNFCERCGAPLFNEEPSAISRQAM